MRAGGYFDTATAAGFKGIEELDECLMRHAIARRMRQHGKPAGIKNPAHRLIQRGPDVFDVTGFARHQITLEHLARVTGKAALDDIARKVRAPQQRRVAAITHGALEGVVNARLCERLRHLASTIVAAGAHLFEALLERQIIRVDPQTQHMNGVGFPRDRHLHTRNEHKTQALRLGLCFGEPTQVVVIGQREDLNTVGMGTTHQIGGPQGAVGINGMAVKIGVLHGAIISECAQLFHDCVHQNGGGRADVASEPASAPLQARADSGRLSPRAREPTPAKALQRMSIFATGLIKRMNLSRFFSGISAGETPSPANTTAPITPRDAAHEDGPGHSSETPPPWGSPEREHMQSHIPNPQARALACDKQSISQGQHQQKLQGILAKPNLDHADRATLLAVLSAKNAGPLVKDFCRQAVAAGKAAEIPALIEASLKANKHALADTLLKSSLTGVVVWPKDIGKPLGAMFEKQAAYGNYLQGAIEVFATDIKNKNFSDFEALWAGATKVRIEAPGVINPRAFTPRDSGSFTPFYDRYWYSAERALTNPRTTPEHLGFDRISELRVGGEGGTAFIIGTEIVDGKVQPRRVPGDAISIHFYLHSMHHAEPETFPATKARANAHYQSAMDAKDPATFEKEAASMYWEVARAVFDYRGSAAKAEIIYRALYEAKGYPPPPLWKPGVSADIEIMLREKEEWLGDAQALQANASDWLQAYQNRNANRVGSFIKQGSTDVAAANAGIPPLNGAVNAEIKKYAWAQEALKALDDPEVQGATQYYRDSAGAKSVNEALRNNDSGTVLPKIGAATQSFTAGEIKATLKKTLVDIPPGTTFTRGFGRAGAGQTFDEDLFAELKSFLRETKPGAVLQEPGFMSTTVGHVLNKFVETNEIEFVFTAGPGVQATPFWTHPALEFESEALFPPGQRFVITGVVEGDDGMLVEATLLPNKTN